MGEYVGVWVELSRCFVRARLRLRVCVSVFVCLRVVFIFFPYWGHAWRVVVASVCSRVPLRFVVRLGQVLREHRLRHESAMNPAWRNTKDNARWRWM